jgi:hypothetical protein
MRQGYKERLEIREVLGSRLGREIVLEPRHSYESHLVISSAGRRVAPRSCPR